MHSNAERMALLESIADCFDADRKGLPNLTPEQQERLAHAERRFEELRVPPPATRLLGSAIRAE